MGPRRKQSVYMKSKSRTLSYVPQQTGEIHNTYLTGYGALNGTTVSNWSAFYVPGYNRGVNWINYGIGKNRTNKCEHLKDEYTKSTGFVQGVLWGDVAHTLSYLTKQVQVGLYDRDPLSTTWSGLPRLSVVTPTDWRSNAPRAIAAMWPEVKSIVSTLNFTIEIPQTKDLARLLPRLVRLARNKRKSTLRKLLAGSSDALLASEFGIRPLIGDLQALASVISHAKKEVNRLLSNEGKELVSHYRMGVPVDGSRTDTIQPYNDTLGNKFDVTRVYTSAASVYTGTLRYSIKFDSKMRAHAHTLGLLDALGLQFNPKFVWDAIPWSFVIDWVAKVGNLLEQLKTSNLAPQVIITDYCHSYKRQFSIEQFIAFGVTNPQKFPAALVSTWAYSYYIREPAVPNTSLYLYGSGLSPRETILGVALALQRLKP